ncbi:MAG: methyltransferase [Treponema sp.]|jgi:[methyl-Co(III) methanol-specific corrinoid protein]:coenzyme M methyltransferase|nr:methyltransferase [Treponema sp.]
MSMLKMSPAERVKAVLAGGDFDVYPAINPTSVATIEVMEIVRSFFPSAHTNAMEMAVLAAAGHDVFGFDSVAPYFSVHLEAAALGAKVDWNDAAHTPVIVKKPVTRIDDFNIPQSFLHRTEFQRLIKACEILKKKYSGRVLVIGKVVGPWTLAYNLYGVENLVLDTVLEPEKTKKLIGELAVIPIEFAKAQFDAGADMITWADHVTSDLVSAKIYEEFLLPVHIKAAKILQKGGPVILHICGNVTDRLDCIARTGFTLFHMDSRNDIAAAVKQVGSSITITGCVNNPVTLGQGTPAMVREEVEANLRSGVRLISPECALPSSVPRENLKCLVKTAHSRQMGNR